MPQTRVLTLNKNQNNESFLFRLEKGWILKFVLGPTLMGHEIHLFTNHPLEADKHFDRGTWYELEWTTTSINKNDDLDRCAEVKCQLAGAFGYYFTCDFDDKDTLPSFGYFQIAPTLTIFNEPEKNLPLDCIQCETVLSKCLGPFAEWEDRLRVCKESGYNVVHFSPVQTLGISNSSYSIADHHHFNPLFSTDSQKATFDDLKSLVAKMKNEWGVLSVCDVVYNHVAKNAAFLKEHPECGYNLQNSPHLRPAFLLDRVLAHFGQDVAKGVWSNRGLPSLITEEHHLDALRSILFDDIFPPQKFHEFFQVDVDRVVDKFAEKLNSYNGGNCDAKEDAQLKIIQDAEFRRLASTIDFDLAIRSVCSGGRCTDPNVRQQCIDNLRQKLVHLNNEAAGKCWEDLCVAVNAILGHVRYERVAGHGPQYRDFNEHHPLVSQYFTNGIVDSTDLKAIEEAMYGKSNIHYMAFNGWVMQDDALKNFAEYPSMVYFRRELICWGDCVKLRYGKSPEDCPFLWNYMKEYTKLTVETFHGLRLDNCHSTPIHAAEYLLDYARSIRPDLYVLAELFTGSEFIDNIFVNRLGITSLVREAQSAGDAHEEGRLVYRYGGEPVGAFLQHPMRPLAPSIAHAIFLDMTHDNPCPISTRTVFDLFPTAALVSMACCATGSNRGYDELVPFHVNVVTEKRFYCSWSEKPTLGNGEVNLKSGIISGRRAINNLHSELGSSGYNEVFVDQVTEDVVAVTRHNPVSHKSVILVARTCFRPDMVGRMSYVPALKVSGDIEEIIFEGKLNVASQSPHKDITRPRARKKSVGADAFIVGATDYSLDIKEHLTLYNSEMVELNSHDGGFNEIEFSNLSPGSVIAFRVSMNHQSQQSILKLRNGLTQFGYRLRSFSGSGLKLQQMAQGTDLKAILHRMTLQDFNRALFRCNEEEADEGKGGGSYNVPKMGSFVYCGLASLCKDIEEIQIKNDLGHPLCDNIRNGNWLVDYVGNRLQAHPGTKELGQWFSTVFETYRDVPHFLKPCYFDAILSGSFRIIQEALCQSMSEFVQQGSDFVRALAISSCIFCGFCRSSLLPPLSADMKLPLPHSFVNESNGRREEACTTISAGLPHFAVGLFRNWGRDTFIALPGCLLVTGRFDEARYIILAFAGSMRHGLIPNLLGSGWFPRFNCRDAVWWWLQAIKIYCELVPNGTEILTDRVRRLYPSDDSLAGQNDKDEPLCDTMQEALRRHFEGIKFRERNAGSAIDEHMRHEGFDVLAGIDEATGFVFGGNVFNCGTWMDKMGSSDKAGNRGQPATPRDGSAVELVGLSYSVVKWLNHMQKTKAYPYDGVRKQTGNGEIWWTWKQWAEKIKQNFERCFWVPENPEESLDPNTHDIKMINLRGIYKDSYRATQPWADYQLRPNFAITLAIAPDLVSGDKALIALKMAETRLKGPLGMKTLDASDLAYNGFYNNADDSTDYRIAKGFNYHQGPEWVWVTGYFLRARLQNAWSLRDKIPDIWPKTVSEVKQTLSRHWTHMQQSAWRSLPELTNKDGALCSDSCPAQAWSIGCVMEVVHDLSQFGLESEM